MTKIEEQCYLAGYNGKSVPPWVSPHMKALKQAYRAGKADRKAGKELTLREGLIWDNGKIRRKDDV